MKRYESFPHMVEFMDRVSEIFVMYRKDGELFV